MIRALRTFATLMLLCLVFPVAAAIPAAERQVLLDLYSQTDGAHWLTNAGWNSATSECSWYGITCDAAAAHVQAIDLSHNRLVGTLPTLASLSGLQIVNVTENQLTGSIPLSGLTHLQMFFAGYNQFSGSLPSLSGLSSLQILVVNDNHLNGPLPSLAGLSNLSALQISANQFSGALPSDTFSGLPKLTGVGIGNNNFTGPLPAPGPAFTPANSTVCPNRFDRTLYTPAFNAAWDKATGTSPWNNGCSYIVTPIAASGGTISPNSPRTVLPSETLQFIITPLPAFFISTTVDTCGAGGSSKGSSSNDGKTYTIEKFTADCTVSVTFIDAVTGLCGTDNGKILATTPTNLCLAGTPSAITGGLPSDPWKWSCYGSNGGGTAACSATVKAWTVQASGGSGGIVIPSAQQVVDGKIANLTVSASSGYQIASVSGCGGGLGADNKTYTTGPITADCTVTASFLSIIPPSFGVCGSDNGKTLAAAPTNLCATGTASGVNGDGHPWTWTCSGTIPPPAFCSATIQTWTVSASAGSGGAITPAAQTVDNGKTAVLSVTPASGYAIASVAGCGGSLGADGKTYTTGGVTADCAVSAAFAPISLTPTMTTLILTPNPAAVNQPVNATVTVSGAAMGAAFPVATAADAPKPLAVAGGSVSVAGGGQTCTVTLVNGGGSCTLSFGIAGIYAIVASYAGDATFAPSSASANLTVNASVPQQSVPAPMLDWRTMLLLAIALCALSPYGRNVIRRRKRKNAA